MSEMTARGITADVPTVRVDTPESFRLEQKLDTALRLIKAEALRAFAKHGPMTTAHEAFGIIYEEFMVEFVAEMHANNADAQYDEMIQVGAMAARAMVDLYLKDAPDGR